jgi:hypothetical protein
MKMEAAYSSERSVLITHAVTTQATVMFIGRLQISVIEVSIHT